MKILSIDTATRGFGYHYASWTEEGHEIYSWKAEDLLEGFGIGDKKSITVDVIMFYVAKWVNDNEDMVREADLIALEAQWLSPYTKHLVASYYGLLAIFKQMGKNVISVKAGSPIGWRRAFFTEAEDGKTLHARKKKSEELVGSLGFIMTGYTQKQRFDLAESFLIGQFVARSHGLFDLCAL